MATSTPTLIDAIRTELQSHLPALLSAENLPAVKAWVYGERELPAVTNTPMIAVDLVDWDQEGGIGQAGRRSNSILVYAIVAASDEETIHRQLHSFADLITKVLETEVVIGTAKPVVTGADMSLTLRRGNALFRACSIEARVRQSRNRGDD